MNPRIVNALNELNVQWPEFVSIIISQDGRPLLDGLRIPVFDNPDGNSYLQEVEACQQSFQTSISFETMTRDDRKLVSGWGSRTTGWFGSMKAAGNFMNITAERPHDLSAALDNVPPEGDVTSANARSCLEAALAIYGVGLAAATRLLAMKRPDAFLSANDASRQKMSNCMEWLPIRLTDISK